MHTRVKAAKGWVQALAKSAKGRTEKGCSLGKSVTLWDATYVMSPPHHFCR